MRKRESEIQSEKDLMYYCKFEEAAKKWEPQSNNHKELNSSNKIELESRISPRVSS